MCVLVSVQRHVILYTAATAQKTMFPFEVFHINERSGEKPSYRLSKQTEIIVIFYKEGQRATFGHYALNHPSSVHFYGKIHLCNHAKS